MGSRPRDHGSGNSMNSPSCPGSMPGRLDPTLDDARLERRPINRFPGRNRPEGIAKALLGLLESRGAAVERDRMAGQLADHAQIVEAVQMVGMRMRQQDGVDRKSTRLN